VDTKINYTVNRHFSVQAGIDNLTNQRYYAYHPFPSRTFFAGLKWKL
jgi:iron complex outermembrane receptor protein